MAFFGKVLALAKSANFNPTTNINIERLITCESSAASQEPTGTGVANAITLEFGPAQGTASDPVQILANGIVKFNVTGLYIIRVSLQFGRTGSAGVSLLHFRASSAGNQLGDSISTKLGNANETRSLKDFAMLNIVAGTVIQYDIMRDSSGNDSGGLFLTVPTIEAGSWNHSPSSSITIDRFIK